MKGSELLSRMTPSRRPTAPVVVLAVGVLASTVVLDWHAREMWFFGDEWDFLYHRALSGGDGPGLLAPHNEHWSTIPLILYRVMWQVVGLQHYQVWMLMPILTLMVGSVAMYALLRRAGASAWIAVICALVLAWNGAGEDTLWAFQVGFLGSLTAGIIGCLVVQEWQSTRGLVLANAMALVALMCSGLGIPMVAWMTLFALLLRGWRIALAVGTVPTLVYAAWYSAYGVSATEQADTAARRLGLGVPGLRLGRHLPRLGRDHRDAAGRHDRVPRPGGHRVPGQDDRQAARPRGRRAW